MHHPGFPRRALHAVLAAAIALPNAHAFAQSLPAAGNRYDAFLAESDTTLELPIEERTTKIEEIYWRLFPRESLDDKSAAELDEALHAAETVTFYTLSRETAARAMEALHALEGRHAATPGHYARAFRALMLSGQLEAADALARAHPDAGIAPLPDHHDDPSYVPGAPAVWALSDDGGQLTRQGVPIDHGLHLVVVSHPLCHFSRNATDAIAKDPMLARVFAEHGHWITPLLRQEDFEVLPEWNRAHPDFRMSSVEDPRSWPGFEFKQTPVFYIVRDGRILDTIVGWPGDGQLQVLRDAIGKAAFIDGSRGQAQEEGAGIARGQGEGTWPSPSQAATKALPR